MDYWQAFDQVRWERIGLFVKHAVWQLVCAATGADIDDSKFDYFKELDFGRE